jgi:hypothetical protein
MFAGEISIGSADYTSDVYVASGELMGTITADDLAIYAIDAAGTTLASGTTVTLHAGIYTTEEPFQNSILNSGEYTYTVYLTDFSGNLLTAVPEPADCAIFAGALALGAAGLRKMAKKHRA